MASKGLPGWEEFVGPCAHGRDPFTRCDTCGLMEPREASTLVLVRELAESLERQYEKHAIDCECETCALLARARQALGEKP